MKALALRSLLLSLGVLALVAGGCRGGAISPTLPPSAYGGPTEEPGAFPAEAWPEESAGPLAESPWLPETALTPMPEEGTTPVAPETDAVPTDGELPWLPETAQPWEPSTTRAPAPVAAPDPYARPVAPPPPPPPPRWDESRDVAVDVNDFGLPSSAPPPEPMAPAPAPTPADAPAAEGPGADSPWMPGAEAVGPSLEPAPPAEAAPCAPDPAAGPVESSEDLGMAPTGRPPRRRAPEEASSPEEATPPAPAPPPEAPPAPAPADSWIPGGETAPVTPPPPSVPAPAAPAPSGDDPWILGGTTEPVSPPPAAPVPSVPERIPPVEPAAPPRRDPPPSAPVRPEDELPPAGALGSPIPGVETSPPSAPEPPPRDATDPWIGTPEGAPEERAPEGPPAPHRRFEFSATRAELAREHADRLLAAPQDPSLGGYPDAVVTKASAAVALESGHKPVVLLFYDDTARASNLQAAEFLPVLAKHADRVDVVAIDLSAAARWTAEERKLVKSYYGAYVPTTVVLSADRKPRLLKYQRITAAVLEAALDRELPR